MTQAILLGAGRGSRLGLLTAAQPKWAAEVAGQSLAQHIVNALHHCDVSEVTLVRGALGGTVATPSVAYRDALRTRNMLETLYSVRDVVQEDVLVAYCDLILEPRLIKALLAGKGPARVVVDRNWQALFALRDDQPLAIAESCRIAGGRLVNIGQPLHSGEQPDAQYIGLMWFDRAMFERLMRLYEELVGSFSSGRWRNAECLSAAYFTDFLQESIDRGIPLEAILVDGGWLEIDTPRDLEAARRLVETPDNGIIDFSALPAHPSVLSAGGVATRRHAGKLEVLLVGSGQHGAWRVPKGMLMAGESVPAAAMREAMEETGIPVRIERYLGTATWSYDYGGQRWDERCHFHHFSALSDGLPVPDIEHEAAAWIEIGRALDGMLYEVERGIVATAGEAAQ